MKNSKLKSKENQYENIQEKILWHTIKGQQIIKKQRDKEFKGPFSFGFPPL